MGSAKFSSSNTLNITFYYTWLVNKGFDCLNDDFWVFLVLEIEISSLIDMV